MAPDSSKEGNLRLCTAEASDPDREPDSPAMRADSETIPGVEGLVGGMLGPDILPGSRDGMASEEEVVLSCEEGGPVRDRSAPTRREALGTDVVLEALARREEMVFRCSRGACLYGLTGFNTGGRVALVDRCTAVVAAEVFAVVVAAEELVVVAAEGRTAVVAPGEELALDVSGSL